MKNTILLLTLLTLISTTLPTTAIGQNSKPLPAKESNPLQLGWMRGFPPPDDKIIRFMDPDYFVFPKLRWTVCNFRQLMPNVSVRNGNDGSFELPIELDRSIDSVTFNPIDSDESMTWDQAFDANYSDGVLVLHHGKVVYERYGGCLDVKTLHGAMSVTKSITGLIGEMLIASGSVDPEAKVRSVVPELADSAFGDATIRQVLNMTTALDYSEDYADPDADVWTYAKAGSPLPPPADYDGPRSYFDFLKTVKKSGAHGEAFGYRTVNSDALGWIIARASGKNVANYLAENIWSQLGTDREAFYTVDSIGTPFAGGGFNATLRDMGRLGLLILNEGKLGDKQIIAAKAIENIRKGGDKRVFAKAGYETLPGWSYRSMWWMSHDDHGCFAARGVHGQTIWIDPTADMVIVRFASHPVAGNAANDPTSLPAYRAVANHLMSQDKP